MKLGDKITTFFFDNANILRKNMRKNCNIQKKDVTLHAEM